ncbi:MAG: enoyl-CoA hydratase/isomerase family protein, partial [Arenicellales bacterium]
MHLEHEDQGGIRILRMQRPPVNALNAELIQNLDTALAQAMQDESVRVVILTGS